MASPNSASASRVAVSCAHHPCGSAGRCDRVGRYREKQIRLPDEVTGFHLAEQRRHAPGSYPGSGLAEPGRRRPPPGRSSSNRSAPATGTWVAVAASGAALIMAAGHRPALLGQACHIQDRAALAFEMRSHAEQRTDGDHPGAADASQYDSIGAVDHRYSFGDLGRTGNGLSTASCSPLRRLAATVYRHVGAETPRQDQPCCAD